MDMTGAELHPLLAFISITAACVPVQDALLHQLGMDYFYQTSNNFYFGESTILAMQCAFPSLALSLYTPAQRTGIFHSKQIQKEMHLQF